MMDQYIFACKFLTLYLVLYNKWDELLSLKQIIKLYIKNMAEKQTTNKEVRHQSAKNKYQHYQRVLSCKNLMKNVTPLTPSPGQFAVTNTTNTQLPKLTSSKSYSILLTKNIKNIMQKPNPAPLNEVLSEVVEMKGRKSSTAKQKTLYKKQQSRETFSKDESTQHYFRRPISAQLYQQTQGKDIEDSMILRNAIEQQRKMKKEKEIHYKNYFQVKSKLKIPKHIQGYRMVSLEEKQSSDSKMSEQNLMIEIQKNLGNIEDKKFEKNFLPTQYYLSQTTTPSQLMQKYKNQDGIVFGFSKWFHNDGTRSWKRCRIIGYSANQQRWEIQWLGSGIIKKVSRNNLYFQNENYEEFDRIVKNAQDLRKKSEVFMKYNMLINLITTPTPEISTQSHQRINSLICISDKDKCEVENLENKNNLIEDVKKLYVRACHEFQFNSMLPYNQNYKKMFSGVLPDAMFSANPRAMIIEDSHRIQTLSTPQCSQLFHNGLKKMKQKCYLSSQKKIKIIELINIISQELAVVDLLKDYKRFQTKNYSVKQIQTLIHRNITEYFYKISCRICDIEHHVSKELDPVYANKKTTPQDLYNSTMSKYHKFLILVNMKLEECLRESVTKVIRKLMDYLPKFDQQQLNGEHIFQNGFVENILFLQQNIPLKLQLTTTIKQGKLQITPSESQFTEVITSGVDRIMSEIKKLKCVSKSYLNQIRPNNILNVINTNSETEEMILLNSTIKELKQKLFLIESNFRGYTKCLNAHIEEIFTVSSEIQKKFQKKNSYGEIQQVVDKVNTDERQLNRLIKINQFSLCGLYSANFTQVKTKYNAKIVEIMKEVSSMLIEKIYKDNEKMDRFVDSILETMVKVPNTIAEFVALQSYVTETVKQQIEKSHHKAKVLTQKMGLLEKTSQIIQYSQFESCCQIYLKPLKLKRVRQQTLQKLENVYKKNFAQELTKESNSVLENIRNCQRMFSQSLQHKTLEEMDANFAIFSNLNSQLQSSCQKMSSINQKELLLKWNITNFDRLVEVKSEFQPYYKLITTHKHYRLNLIPLMDEAFSQINYQSINNSVSSSIDTLKNLLNHRFNGNSTYEPIVESILKEYNEFNSNLSLIKTLRNPDLRDRHWIIIQKITGVSNIRSDDITLKQILSEPIKSQQSQLAKVSQIATKQLIYEKSLNLLKRQWKDVRITTKEAKVGNETYKFFKNTTQIEKKLQNDIIEVNNILSSSFIKFLQVDVLQWKSTVLQKVYEFINYWPGFESKIIYYVRLMNFPQISEIYPGWLTSHKNLEKTWKQFISTIQFQSLIVDVVNSRTWQIMNTLESLMEEIQKMLCTFLEQKKKVSPKLRLFSDETLISMMTESNAESTFENLRRCFTGARSLKKIDEVPPCKIQIMSTLDEPIFIKLEKQNQNLSKKSQKIIQKCEEEEESTNTYKFDSLLLSIDRQLKKQIKSTFLSSLFQQSNENKLLGQVQLLRSRLIFKNSIQKQYEKSQTLNSYELEIASDKREICDKMRTLHDGKSIKVYSLLLIQLINQLNLVQNLNKNQEPLNTFEWFKQPKYELTEHAQNVNNSKLKLIIGNYSRQYLFELVQCQRFVANPLSDATFLNIHTAMSDKMMVILQGCEGSGRAASLNYLGQLMGKNVTNVVCSSLTTPFNMLEYLKTAASGIFLIVQEMQRLTKECLSVFDQSLAQFWLNYQLSRNNITNFKINAEQIVLDINNFSFFGICSSSQNLSACGSMKQCFRTFIFVPMEIKYLLQCALYSYGFTQIQKVDINFIPTIISELNYHKYMGKMININTNNFIWQVAKKFQQISQEIEQQEENKESQSNYNRLSLQTDILYESVEQVLKMYIPSSQNMDKNEIWSSLYNLKLLRKQNNLAFIKIKVVSENELPGRTNKHLDGHEIDIDKQFVNDEEYVKKIEIFKEIINFHCGAVVVGPRLSGKSSLITKLIQQNSQSIIYNFVAINPMAYTMKQLYEGHEQQKSIIEQLIQQIKMKSTSLDHNKKVINGIYFDSGVGQWVEPLLSVINKPKLPKISCSDGSLLTLPSRMKIIFEVQKLEHITPNNIHSLGIVMMSEEIKWKNLFGELLRKYFKNQFTKTQNAYVIKQIFQETIDSVFEFYESIFTEKSVKGEQKIKFPLLQRPALLEFVVRFFSIIYYKEDISLISLTNTQEQNEKDQKQHEDKIKSEIFNIFIYSLLSTIGLMIPEESRKTFSRHFKYVLGQTQLCRYSTKKSHILSKEEENIYEYYYEEGEWKKWKSQNHSNFSDNFLFFDKYQMIMRALKHHVENGISCFIVGQECSSKNYIFKHFMSNLQSQKFTRNYFIFSSLTLKFGIVNKISEMILTQKYSKKLNGFSNCKKNLIYVQDLNMALLSDNPQKNGSVVEFIKEFYRKKALYINNSLHGFRNLQFYGTLNQSLPIPQNILRFLNPILMSNPENRIRSILQYNIRTSPITSIQKQLVIRCTQNLHDVIKRDLTQSDSSLQLGHKFYMNDMIRVVKGVCKITQNLSTNLSLSSHSILRYWVYMVSKIYEQKINTQSKSILFYLINNVLMEEQRIRYKTICPNSDFYVLSLPSTQLPKVTKNSRSSYEIYTITSLKQKLYTLANKFEYKNKYLSMFLDENSQQIVKLIARFLNSFDFESEIIILFNEQRRKIQPILKIASLITHSMHLQSQDCSISHEIEANEEKQKILTYKFTKQYLKYFANSVNQKICSHFASPLQTKTKIQAASETKTILSIKSEKFREKNKVVIHFKDSQNSTKNNTENSNFILQDLLSYIKLGKHPKWAIPKEQILQYVIQNTGSSICQRKNRILSKMLLNRDSQEMDRQEQQIQQLCQNMKLNFVLQYHQIPQYLLKNYRNLIDECSLMFLKNNPEPAQYDKASKVIVTEVKIEQETLEDWDLNIGFKNCSSQQISKYASTNGDKVYMDLTYEVFNTFLRNKIGASPDNKPLAHKYSFRKIFNKFLTLKRQRDEGRINVQIHAKQMLEAANHIKQKLEFSKREEIFNLSQHQSKLEELVAQIEKEQQKYESEKKKIQQIKDKIFKKQKEYEENLQFYRQSMDKLSFQFNKAKEKLLKVIIQFQNGKYNFANVLKGDNKAMLQSLTFILEIADIKKNEDGAAALRELTKFLKEKKVSKLMQKVGIENLSKKAMAKVQKVVIQIDNIKVKTTENSSNKKIAIVEKPADQCTILRASLSQFLQICLLASKQFYSQKINQAYENFQSAGKSIQKLKADLLKKQKSKVLKQLFENYDKITIQKQQVEEKIKIHNTNILVFTETLTNLQKIITSYIPQVVQTSNFELKNGQQKESNALLMSICVRFFNQFYALRSKEVTKMFVDLKEKLTEFAVLHQNWLKDINIDQGMAISSLFNYKGFVLVQIKHSKYSCQQNRSVIDDLLYRDKNCKQVREDELQLISPLEITQYDAIVIKIDRPQQTQSIEKVQRILNMEIDEQYWGKAIIIQSNYFSGEQINNYPYINFISQDNGITLPYKYIYGKVKNELYPQNMHFKTEQKENTKQNRNNFQMNNQKNELISNFMKIKLQNEFDIENVNNCYKKLEKIFTKYGQQVVEEKVDTQLQCSQQENEQKPEVALTEKQKQKLLSEQRTCEFFTKYYIILDKFYSVSKQAQISLDRYLLEVGKIFKMATTTASGTTSVSYDSISSKYISKFIKYYPHSMLNLPKYFLLLLTNAKISGFGSEQNYSKYLCLCIEEVFNLTNNVTTQKGQQRIEEMKNKVDKFRNNIEGFETLCEEIREDFDLWEDDLQNLYKQKNDPPIEWVYFMICADKDKFWQFISKMERKLIQKQVSDPTLYDYTPTQEKLQAIFIRQPQSKTNTPLTLNFHTNHHITPIFLQTSHCYSEIVTFLLQNKLQWELIDFKRLKALEHSMSQGNQKSRKSQKLVQPQHDLFGNEEKITLTFVQNQAQLKQLENFIQAYEKRYEQRTHNKLIHQQETSQAKIIIFSNLRSYEHIKNSIVFSEQNQSYSKQNLIHANSILNRFYSKALKDKVKTKQYDNLPLKIKRSIFNIQASVIESIILLPFNVETDIYYVLKRCLSYVDKLAKSSKPSKQSNLSISENELQTWKFSLIQIFLQNAFAQIQMIHHIIKNAQDQANIFIDEQGLNQNKLSNMLSESKTQQKINKFLVKFNLAIKNKYLAKLKSRSIQEHSISNNVVENYKKIIQSDEEKGNKKESQLSKNFSNVYLGELTYLISRKCALEHFLSASSVSCTLQLITKQAIDEEIIYISSGFQVRQSLQKILEQTAEENTNTKYAINLNPVLKMTTSQIRSAGNKGKLVTHPQFKTYQISIPAILNEKLGNQQGLTVIDYYEDK